VFHNLNKLRSFITFASALVLLALNACEDYGASPDASKPAICEHLPTPIHAATQTKCNPGVETKPAWCSGQGMTGRRTCRADGISWERAVCPKGEPFNQEARLLFVVTKNVREHPDFNYLADVIASQAGLDSWEAITVREAKAAFPEPDTQTSMRTAVQKLFFGEFNNLWGALYIGSPDMRHWGQPVTELIDDDELPLWYDESPFDPGDSETESRFVNLKPYMWLRLPWNQVRTQTRTPREDFDLYAGYLRLTGAPGQCASGNCKSDLANLADKLVAWKRDWESKPFSEAQFDGFPCNGGQRWGDWSGERAQRAGVTHELTYHDCTDGKFGNAWDIAKADGAKMMSTFFHGNGSGSSNYNSVTQTGLRLVERDMCFPGPVYAFACLVGSSSLGGDLLGSECGPTGLAAYSRLLYGDILSPTTWAVVKGRYTLGEMVYGFANDRAGNSRVENRSADILLLQGVPNQVVIPRGTKTLEAVARRMNDDGSVEVCVEAKAPAGMKSDVLVGSRKVAELDFSQEATQLVPMHLTADEAADRKLIHFSHDKCDPKVETCRPAEAYSTRDYVLHCGELVRNGNDTYSVPVKAPVGLEGSDPISLAVRISARTMTCEGGFYSNCYVDFWGGGSQVEITKIPITKLLPEIRDGGPKWEDSNWYDFTFNGLVLPKGRLFQSLEVEVVGASDVAYAGCSVPLTLPEIIDIDTTNDVDLL
jgi:hypothetical protein